jgi:uric acid transporter
MIIIAGQHGGGAIGLTYVYGAMLVSGIFGLIIAKPFSMMVRFFPPLVTGTVITVIGLSLIGADAGLITGKGDTSPTTNLPFSGFDGGYTVTAPTSAGPINFGGATPSQTITTSKGGSISVTPQDYGKISHIVLAGLVILIMVLISRFFRGFIGQIAVLLGIVAGVIISWPMNLLHFTGSKAADSIGSADWVGISAPFHFGHPKFVASAIISMCIVVLVTYTESTADMLAVAEMVEKPLTPNDLARGLATDGLSALLAGFMNSFPDTAYAENVGLVAITRVRSRWVVTTCGGFLVILGLIPKMGAIIADLPKPVIGGAGTVMFAMVTAVGIRTLAKVDFERYHNNLLIVAVSLSVGLLPVIAPDFYRHFPANFQTIFGSAITSTVIVVFVLNLVFNHWVRGGQTISVDAALEAGAVAPDPPYGGVHLSASEIAAGDPGSERV